MVAGWDWRLAHFRGRVDRPPTVVQTPTAALTVRLELTHRASDSAARAGVLHTSHGSVETPFTCVVGTAGSVESVTPAELRRLGAGVLLANTYALLLRPGAEVVRELGGLHRYMAWDGPLMTDSGCFEVFSLGFEPRETAGNQAPRLVRVDEDGAIFTSHIDGSRQRLTPESSIALQEALGADISLAFAEPTSVLQAAEYVAQAMERTHRWARRCIDARQRPDRALYGMVQGGAVEALRTCSARLIGTLPFDGAAIGGSLGASRADMHAVLDWCVPQLPAAWPRHLPGFGDPLDLFACVERGIDQFDSVAPTRLAGQGVLYTPDGRLHLTRPQHKEDPRPVQAECGCYTCSTGFSRAYLRHLFAARELLAYTLSNLHNLYFVQQLMRQIREAIRADRLSELRDGFLSRYTLV